MRLNTKQIRRKVKYKLLYGFVTAVIYTANVLPHKVWLLFCEALGKLLFRITPKLREQIKHHLSMAFANEKTPDQIKALTHDVFVMLAKNAGVVLRDFKNSASGFKQQSITYGVEHAEKAFYSGRGVIFLTAHLGPFESIAHDLSLRGYHPYIVGTPLKDPELNKLLTKNRSKFGAVAIERGKETYRIMKNISTGGTMAILIDQDTSVKSVFVNFFGRSCSTPIGATVMALKTGAAIIPVFAHLNKHGMKEITYYPEVEMKRTGNESEDILVNTQTLTTIIENEIRKYPEQWVWMHRRWKTKPKAETDMEEKELVMS